jgi:hypothetical protein
VEIANGSWTYLGGDDGAEHYGLFMREASQNGNLVPQWRQLMVADLKQFSAKLESAHEIVRAVKRALLIQVSEGRKVIPRF